jgi:hypothetical protein
LSPGVFECFYCRPFQTCNVCDSKRKITQNSKLFVFVNKIIDLRLQEKLKILENNFTKAL